MDGMTKAVCCISSIKPIKNIRSKWILTTWGEKTIAVSLKVEIQMSFKNQKRFLPWRKWFESTFLVFLYTLLFYNLLSITAKYTLFTCTLKSLLTQKPTGRGNLPKALVPLVIRNNCTLYFTTITNVLIYVSFHHPRGLFCPNVEQTCGPIKRNNLHDSNTIEEHQRFVTWVLTS